MLRALGLHAIHPSASYIVPLRPSVSALCLVLLLSACSTTKPDASLLDKTLGLIGLQTAEAAPPVSAEVIKAMTPNKTPLRIHASDQLNSDGANRPLSLVVKVYKLKAFEDFVRAPYTAFTQDGFKSDDVISSREVVLLPGQRYEVEENLPKEAAYLAVVALYKSPDANRWRFVFDLASSAKDGVTLGAHQCALSVSQGDTVGVAPESRRLAGTVCR